MEYFKGLIVVRWRLTSIFLVCLNDSILAISFLITSISTHRGLLILHSVRRTISPVDFSIRYWRGCIMSYVMLPHRTQSFIDHLHDRIPLFFLDSHNIHIFYFVMKRWIGISPAAKVWLPLVVCLEFEVPMLYFKSILLKNINIFFISSELKTL
jgi:hypothetical protein